LGFSGFSGFFTKSAVFGKTLKNLKTPFLPRQQQFHRFGGLLNESAQVARLDEQLSLGPNVSWVFLRKEEVE
jgi:hypothetical protein